MTVTAQSLSRTQKAAVILVAMGKPTASRLLKFFKQDELKALIEAARELRAVPQSDLERIVGEFEEEFTEGAGLLDSADEMDSLFSETLSSDEMNALMGFSSGEMGPVDLPPVWPDIEKLAPARVATLIEAEHPQVAAVILSNLAPAAASAALLVLEKPVRAEVVQRMIGMGNVAPAGLALIENSLRRRLEAEGGARDSSVAQIKVASVLNEMDKTVLDEVMQDLEEAGTPDLAAIRARLFSFEDIVNLTQKARVALFDDISAELVTLALRNAGAGLVEAILSAMGARARRMIEAELAQGGDSINPADIVRARRTIASTAIRMANEGAFELPSATPAAA